MGGPKHGFAVGSGHSRRRHPLYNAWVSIKQRCTNPNHHKFPSYGGRKTRYCPDGIYRAPEWDDFAQFVKDVGEPPGGRYDLYSIDRINNDGPYAPGNVRWSTASQQRRNQYREPWPFGVLAGEKDGAPDLDTEERHQLERERFTRRYPDYTEWNMQEQIDAAG